MSGQEARSAAQGRRRVRMELSDGYMDACVSPDASPETLAALRAVGEAALARMKGDTVTELIGRKATIVGYSTEGDRISPENESVAHICLDIEDGPRVFFQAVSPDAVMEILEEER